MAVRVPRAAQIDGVFGVCGGEVDDDALFDVGGVDFEADVIGLDGELAAAAVDEHGGSELREYLTEFVSENPELLPARLAGGSGASAGQRSPQGDGRVDLDKIRPGMSPEDKERVRQEIARVASQTLRGV